LSKGFEVVCLLLSDKINKETLGQLSENGIRLIGLSSAGFDNVDTEAAEAHSIKVMNIPGCRVLDAT
jgi:lactate dehydrogenase-like 2-hydroxyacid dehydrogenase